MIMVYNIPQNPILIIKDQNSLDLGVGFRV